MAPALWACWRGAPSNNSRLMSIKTSKPRPLSDEALHLIAQRFAAEMKAGRCSCEIRNPQAYWAIWHSRFVPFVPPGRGEPRTFETNAAGEIAQS